MKLLSKYKNGNYSVKLYDNGTKIRFTKANTYESEFPENIDIKITDYCDAGCPFCHEGSSVKGTHGDLLSYDFYKSLRPGTELAIGGGNPLSHPQLDMFLYIMREQGIICNITVNSKHLNSDAIHRLEQLVAQKYIYGIGVSVNRYNPEAIEFAKTHNNVVIHVINGVMPYDDLMKMASEDVKILILGYKQFRRGKNYMDTSVTDKMIIFKENLNNIMHSFHTVSFDNLAIKQLEPQRHMSAKEWQQFYMGDDGNFTMYIDMVKQQFALNSISESRYDLMQDIDSMFKIVKENKNEPRKILSNV
jgi:hypothetical protein